VLLLLLCICPICDSSPSLATAEETGEGITIWADTGAPNVESNCVGPNLCNPTLNCLCSDVDYLVRFPCRLDEKDIMILGGISLATGSLILADDDIQDFFGKKHTGPRDDFADFFETLGSFEVVLLGNAGLTGAGWVLRDSKEGNRLFKTAFISTEAQLFTEGICAILKFAVGRDRPEEDHGHTSFNPFKHWNASFPSAHAARSFAMAAVFSETYEQPFPIIAYTAATLVSLSRVYQDKHFFSDAFVGAVIGYSIGKALICKHQKSNYSWTISPVIMGSSKNLGIMVYSYF